MSHWFLEVAVLIVDELLVVAPGLFAVGLAQVFEPDQKLHRMRQIDFPAIVQAIDTYRLRSGHLPPDLHALVTAGIAEQVPTDPWNRPYLYALRNRAASLASLGRDGIPGGAGSDADSECCLSASSERCPQQIRCYALGFP